MLKLSVVDVSLPTGFRVSRGRSVGMMYSFILEKFHEGMNKPRKLLLQLIPYNFEILNVAETDTTNIYFPTFYNFLEDINIFGPFSKWMPLSPIRIL